MPALFHGACASWTVIQLHGGALVGGRRVALCHVTSMKQCMLTACGLSARLSASAELANHTTIILAEFLFLFRALISWPAGQFSLSALHMVIGVTWVLARRPAYSWPRSCAWMRRVRFCGDWELLLGTSRLGGASCMRRWLSNPATRPCGRLEINSLG